MTELKEKMGVHEPPFVRRMGIRSELGVSLDTQELSKIRPQRWFVKQPFLRTGRLTLHRRPWRADGPWPGRGRLCHSAAGNDGASAFLLIPGRQEMTVA